ncbi:protein lethal(2)essential for life-like [Palaemon carinicauda]
MNSPLIQQEGDCKQLKLRFDVSQYKPEEIVVKTVDNKLLVHAKHEEKSDSRSVYREYNREFLLPKGTNPELIKSSLSKDGVLTVEAPLPAIAGTDEKVIPIAQN